MKERYVNDEWGLYDASLFDRTGLKARPLDFDEGEVNVDEPGKAATRAQWRSHNERRNGATPHRNTGDLGPYGHAHEMTARVEITVK